MAMRTSSNRIHCHTLHLVVPLLILFTLLQHLLPTSVWFHFDVAKTISSRFRHLYRHGTVSSLAWSTVDHIHLSHISGDPLLTVVIPLKDAAKYIPRMMETLLNQSYQNIEIIVSLDPSDDLNETRSQLQKYQKQIDQASDTSTSHDHQHHHEGLTLPVQRIEIYEQPHQLYYSEAMNFLLSKIPPHSKYYAYMQCDDGLPRDYYQKLVHCLERNSQAVNCYPKNLYFFLDNDRPRRRTKQLDFMKATPQPSAVGRLHERIEKTMPDFYYFPHFGVTRKLSLGTHERNPFTYPRIYKAFAASDATMITKMVTYGELIAVEDVSYYKAKRALSMAHMQLLNSTVMPNEDLIKGITDSFIQRYNIAHSYAASSHGLAEKASNFLVVKILQTFSWARTKNESVIAPYLEEATEDFWRGIHRPKRVAILGAGIQGCLMALMFRKHGYDVTIIDQANDIMTSTSTLGEEPVRLGLEYVDSSSLENARFALKSAMQFSHQMEAMISRKLDWSKLRSEHRLTSLLPSTSSITADQVEKHGQDLNEVYEAILKERPELSYLGERPPKVIWGRTEVPNGINGANVKAAFPTIERTLHTNKLRETLRDALHDMSVDMVFNRTILKVRRNSANTTLQSGDTAIDARLGKLRVVSNVGEHDYDVVVNCLSEGHASIDNEYGLNHRKGVKRSYVRSGMRLRNSPRFRDEIPSVAILGRPFRDFIAYSDKNDAYFSVNKEVGETQPKNATKSQGLLDLQTALQMLFPGYNTSFLDSAYMDTGLAEAYEHTYGKDSSPYLIDNGYISMKAMDFTSGPYCAYLLQKELFLKEPLPEKSVPLSAK